MRFNQRGVKTPKHHCWYQQGKVCYDKKGAITAANLRYKEAKVWLRVYWCHHCNFFHLTKKAEILDIETYADPTPKKSLVPKKQRKVVWSHSAAQQVEENLWDNT